MFRDNIFNKKYEQIEGNFNNGNSNSNKKWIPFRRRKILSPVQRGCLLAGVFALWICYSSISQTFLNTNNENGRLNSKQFEGVSVGGRKLLDTVTITHQEDEDNCTLPAITQFPGPLLSKGALYGLLILHIVVAVYMFMGLAIVCDEYFVPALDRIAESLNLPPDVAGATFMAAGSSGPELATAVIGVFVAKDDIGISGVIGSAVFNITLVIAVCALSTTTALQLSWYPVVRDCTCYLISIFVLLCTISNELISWPEALIFLILYVIYCVAMAFNSQIEALVKSKVPVPASWEEASQAKANADLQKKNAAIANANGNKAETGGAGMEMKSFDEVPMSPTNPPPAPAVHAVEPPENHLEKPVDGGPLALVKFFSLFPLYFVAKYTIPDCRTERFHKLFVASFLISIVWISLFAYVMVWMITVIGFTLGIPDTVMGLTFIAAGVSVPDALGGVAVIREGHGDMAVSNAIGSNVFDILVCLGLPWFLDTAIFGEDEYVKVRSKGLVYSTFSLFSTVVFLIVLSHFNGWKLDKKFGYILLGWYFVFMIFASLYELNVFGEFNPPECDIYTTMTG